MIDNLYFATTNKYKLQEAKEILNINIMPINRKVEEIQDIEVDNVVRYKAHLIYKLEKKNVIVEDTGLYFESLNGFPGALIKWVLACIGTDGSLENGSKNDNIIKLLSQFNNKRIYAKTSIGFTSSNSISDVVIVSSIMYGKMPLKARGKEGFGWDDIFIPDGYNKTFAEMGKNMKNNISMRKMAFIKLKKLFL